MKYIVDRKTWYRGQGHEESQLLRQDGTRCCIGFVGQQCGLSDSYLFGKKSVFNARYDKWPDWFNGSLRGCSEDLIKAYTINDNKEINDEQREKQLIEIFAKNGDEIEFIN